MSQWKDACIGAFTKLNPVNQLRNPVMFVVYIGAIVTACLTVYEMATGELLGNEPDWFTLWITLWLWFTVLFANAAESFAEGRGKAQAESLRALRKEVNAKKLRNATHTEDF
ncbi:MAG: hypothetical protein K2Q01_02620, partial [Rickettsiales bacterium]|nr:hypothetical protein [Rickettsiales bacterium]